MGGTILLADDSITIQKVVELTFAGTDAEVVAVGSGQELLQRLPAVKPDVVLCDVVMPDMNGYDVCQAIKCDPATLHVPVVLLTGTFEPFDRERAIAVGCDSIVTKPFEARELVSLVEDLLRKSVASWPAQEATGERPFDEPASEGLDFTTTGFEQMVAAPQAPPAPPEEGIDLTGSFRAEQVEETPFETVREADTQPVVSLDGDEAGPLGEPDAVVAQAEAGAVLSEGLAEAGVEAFAVAMAAEPAVEDDGEGEEMPAPAQEATEVGPPAGAPPVSAATGSDGAAAFRLADEDVERIARRVVELNAEAIERIAWEIIPDMAEMLVRKRIRELEAAVEDEN